MRNLELRNSRSWRAAAQTRGKIAPTEFAENAEAAGAHVAPAFTIVAVFLFESARSLRSFVPLPPG